MAASPDLTLAAPAQLARRGRSIDHQLRDDGAVIGADVRADRRVGAAQPVAEQDVVDAHAVPARSLRPAEAEAGGGSWTKYKAKSLDLTPKGNYKGTAIDTFVFTFDGTNADAGGAKADPAKSKSADKAFDEAYAAFDAGDYDKSGSLFSAFLSSYPGSARIPEVRFWLGYGFYMQSAFYEALMEWYEVVVNYPDNDFVAYALFYSGLAYVERGECDLALQC